MSQTDKCGQDIGFSGRRTVAENVFWHFEEDIFDTGTTLVYLQSLQTITASKDVRGQGCFRQTVLRLSLVSNKNCMTAYRVAESFSIAVGVLYTHAQLPCDTVEEVDVTMSTLSFPYPQAGLGRDMGHLY